MVGKKISSELVYRSTDTLVILSIVLIASVYDPNYDFLNGYLAAGLGASLIFGLVGRFTDIYTSWSGRPFFRDEAMRTVVTWLTTFFLLVFIIFIAKSSEQFSRVVLVGWLVTTPFLLVLTRYILRVLLSHLKRIGIRNRNIAIVGITETGLRFADSINTQPESGLQVAGFYSVDLDTANLPSNYAKIGNTEDLLEAARNGTWDQIYLALPTQNQNLSSQLISQLADTITPVRLIPDNFTHALLHNKYLEIADTPVLCIYDAPLSVQHALVKRAEDLIIGSLILFLILPIMAVIALAIKISSPGPVLFKQARHGLRGEEFQVWKFRTMTVCENGDVIKQATRNDVRVTKVGAFLRKTSLDELPQFFNVIQGHMSIVGPRPHAVAHNEAYKVLIPGYMQRHMMKPGITGWAQVNGWRGETDTLYKMQKRVECDMEYIRSWSLWLDLRIIVATAFKTLSDKNAY
ncbi:undecaprenyl-phosphate glucose phosphotransferase [uncultured Thiothrix sp.]|uniref:undecaprenyl-phosphate glucose phosphotransferase n=1 Tax=uncultured Thiothrix sp. TaxID=223185 RepID=UPI00260D83C4|nr:undecaprenyl-phosphate glucose phosphotransferase [uncultured Thiothrix sp.]